MNDKISQRLIQILEFRGVPQHARPLTPRPIIGLGNDFPDQGQLSGFMKVLDTPHQKKRHDQG